jgi:hypothetical protein
MNEPNFDFGEELSNLFSTVNGMSASAKLYPIADSHTVSTTQLQQKVIKQALALLEQEELTAEQVTLLGVLLSYK